MENGILWAVWVTLTEDFFKNSSSSWEVTVPQNVVRTNQWRTWVGYVDRSPVIFRNDVEPVIWSGCVEYLVSFEVSHSRCLIRGVQLN